MNELENKLIQLCKDFTQKADALEVKAFHDRDYQENWFFEDFNKLFDEYAYGKQNRTVSMDFRNPPRYSMLKDTIHEKVEPLSKTQFCVTFENVNAYNTIRFIIAKKLWDWKLIRYESSIWIAQFWKDKWKEIARKNKL